MWTARMEQSTTNSSTHWLSSYLQMSTDAAPATEGAMENFGESGRARGFEDEMEVPTAVQGHAVL